jgi:hypothetical protein
MATDKPNSSVIPFLSSFQDIFFSGMCRDIPSSLSLFSLVMFLLLLLVQNSSFLFLLLYMIEQMDKDAFYSTLCNLLLVYVSDNSRKSAMVSHHKQWRDYWCDERQRPRCGSCRTAWRRLYKQIVLIAALKCVAAFVCLLQDSKFDIRRSRV